MAVTAPPTVPATEPPTVATPTAPAPAAATPTAPAPAAPAAALMTESRRKLGMMLCLVTIVLAVLDMNIVSAATVPIVRDLDPVHGVDRLPWLVSAFALAATALLPLYGKLCDLYGAKRY